MSVYFQNDEDRTALQGRHHGDPVACERCAAPVELVTILPRRTDHSGYRIFACTVCSLVQWIPE